MKKLALVAVLLAAGCHKKQPPAPFKGPLTVDVIMSTKELVQPFMPWNDAFALLQSKLGPPTQTTPDHKYWWAAMDGDTCAYTMVEQDDGKRFHKDGPMVGEVQVPAKYAKGDAIMNRAECLKLVGKGPQEDPNAKAPPADGSPVPAAELATEAPKARSKWEGKDIKVTGVIKSVSGNVATLADGDKTVSCTTPNGNFAFDDKPTTMHGTVKLDSWVNGAGEEHLEARLEPCDFVR